jgi:hypothetical protein
MGWGGGGYMVLFVDQNIEHGFNFHNLAINLKYRNTVYEILKLLFFICKLRKYCAKYCSKHIYNRIPY